MARHKPTPENLHFVIGDFPEKELICSCWSFEKPANEHKARLEGACPEVRFRIEVHESGWGFYKNWTTIGAACLGPA